MLPRVKSMIVTNPGNKIPRVVMLTPHLRFHIFILLKTIHFNSGLKKLYL